MVTILGLGALCLLLASPAGISSLIVTVTSAVQSWPPDGQLTVSPVSTLTVEPDCLAVGLPSALSEGLSSSSLSSSSPPPLLELEDLLELELEELEVKVGGEFTGGMKPPPSGSSFLSSSTNSPPLAAPNRSLLSAMPFVPAPPLAPDAGPG